MEGGTQTPASGRGGILVSLLLLSSDTGWRILKSREFQALRSLNPLRTYRAELMSGRLSLASVSSSECRPLPGSSRVWAPNLLVDTAQERESLRPNCSAACSPSTEMDPETATLPCPTLPCPAPTCCTLTGLEQKHPTNRNQSLRREQGALTPPWEKLGNPG